MAKHRYSIPKRLHLYFFPHRHNGYAPHFFSTKSVVGVLALIILLEGAYLGGVALLTKTNFLAAVLPGTLVALTNSDRATNDAGMLTEDPLLAKAAQLKANDMAANGYFAHVSPSGKTPWYWLQQVGYQYGYAGENLAVNFTDSIDVETAWMHSPAHRANIVKSVYTKVGIATAEGEYEGKPTIFVVQFFASPKGGETGSGAASAAPVASVPKTPPASEIATPPTGKVAVATTETSIPAATTSAVLGTETVPNVPVGTIVSAPNFFERILSAPNHLIEYVLYALSILIALLLIVALLVKMRVPHVGVVVGGLILLVAASGALFLNEKLSTTVVVPSGQESASAFSALQ